MNPFNLNLVADLESLLRWLMLLAFVRAVMMAHVATKPPRIYVRVKSRATRPGRGL